MDAIRSRNMLNPVWKCPSTATAHSAVERKSHPEGSQTRIIVFFDPRDIACFECACSNRELFSQFRKLLARNTVSGLTYTLKSAAWIFKRNVYPTKVLIGKFVSEPDVILFTEVASKVREIEFKEGVISHRAFCSLVKHCTQLRTFHVCSASFMSVSDYIRITKSCSLLVDLSIHLSSLTHTDLRSILAQSPQLTAIDVSDCTSLNVNPLVNDLSRLCPKLESLTATQFLPATAGSEPYSVLADKLAHLRKLHCAPSVMLHSIAPTAIDSLFGRCVPLVELSLHHLAVSDVTLWRIVQRSVHLRVFRYIGSNLSAARIVHIATRCSDLRELDVTCIEYNADSAVTAVTKHCTNLHTLTLRNCMACTDNTLHAIATHCTRYLTKLDLLLCKYFTAPAIHSVVRQCTSLTHLQLSRYTLSSDELCEMVSHCPQLTSLELHEPYLSINDSVVYAICVYMKKLNHVYFTGYHLMVSDVALVHLLTARRTMHSVRIINTSSVYRDLGIVSAAEDCPSLRELRIGYCNAALYMALTKLRVRCLQQRRDFVADSMVQIDRTCC